ncbi:hypothetical protein UFOVP183_29 [uncultured Caudovirales phage]|uniref:Uncharacterized protein n=1 Tax=uncultured Caudovirales phage TaxID=2100421 RepID=A0A6J7WGK6_9CAUD|nr:hypothetical protein UFOVP183_29 [uncultured Caudovirales phage]
MKIATSELEHLREEIKNCHRIIKDLQKKREFFGLTDEERKKVINTNISTGLWHMAKDIEAKLRSKNEHL